MHPPELLPITDPVQLGQILRRKRREQKMTLQTVSEHSGFSMRFISEVERGKPTAEIGRVLALLRMVGVDIFARPR